MSVSLAFEKGQDGEELFVEIEQEFSMRARGALGTCRLSCNMGRGGSFARGALLSVCAILLRKMLSCAGNRESLFVKEALDFEDGLDILAAVEAVAARAFHRLERGEFGLPIAQDKSLRGRQAAHLPDAK